ncbi:SNF5-domain-containing protein [Gymnopus androsaceus JB14]|uniref:SNF5-domain-containing protein n=1 Tax=Gymnopus androsaceus JB14 TaxID=1447944 RepID=A0A6A4GGV0_9AGAR|nr:SNF5-domain-containing protein [Gymnopus androsaceus JB14]
MSSTPYYGGVGNAATAAFSNMSDAQLRQAISQLAAGASGVGFPQAATPAPATASRSRSTRSTTAAAAAPAVLQLHPQVQPSLAPPQPLPPSSSSRQTLQLWPPTNPNANANVNAIVDAYKQSLIPQPPAPIIPTHAQAGYSTYASRLRTGATLLVQPTVFPFNTGVNTQTGYSNYNYSYAGTGSGSLHHPSYLPQAIPPSSSSTFRVTPAPTLRPSRSSRRARGTVNYAELGSDEELDTGAGADSDGTPMRDDATDADFVVSSTRGGGGRSRGTPMRAQPQPSTDTDLTQSYLGLGPPPSRYIRANAKSSTAANVGGVMAGIDYGSCEEYTRECTITKKAREVPIPIRVEFETDSGLRIRDAFVWNIHEFESPNAITPRMFAAQFCEDVDIPVEPYAETIAEQIRAQVEEARGEAWVGVWGRVMGTDLGLNDQEQDQIPTPIQLDAGSMAVDSNTTDTDTTPPLPEIRVLLSIDVQLGLTHHLLDHIEWDLFSPLTPEVFASQLCRELGLGGEAVSLVACAVHDELRKHRRDVVEWGLVDDSLIVRKDAGETTWKDKSGLASGGRRDRDREGRYPRPLRSAFRDYQESEEYGTRWEELSQEEMERREVERERAARRLRREVGKWRRR